MGVRSAEASVNADDIHKPLSLLRDLRFRHGPFDFQRLLNSLLHGKPRIYGRIGILKDDLHIIPDTLELPALYVCDILAFKLYFTSRIIQKMDNRPAKR